MSQFVREMIFGMLVYFHTKCVRFTLHETIFVEIIACGVRYKMYGPKVLSFALSLSICVKKKHIVETLSLVQIAHSKYNFMRFWLLCGINTIFVFLFSLYLRVTQHLFSKSGPIFIVSICQKFLLFNFISRFRYMLFDEIFLFS